MDELSNEQRAELKEIIIRQIESLTEDVARMNSGQKPITPDTAIGRLSRLEAMNAQGVASRALRGKTMRLERLQAALRRIDEEEYGICARCEEPIGMGRLRVVPESAVCIACAEGRE